MRILNDDTLLGYEGESYNRIIKIEIEEKYKDYDVYLEFHIIGENKYYTSTKLDTNVSEYLIPYELLKKKNYVDVQLVAYFGADIVSKSDKKLFIVKESINAVDIIINEEGGFKNFKEIIKDELKEYIENKTGNLNNLTTETKENLVEAINEVNGKQNVLQPQEPKETYENLSALQTAYPNGASGVYLTTDNGYWNYWDGTEWKAGAVYQSSEDINQLKEEIVNNANINGIIRGNNLFDKYNVENGYFLLYSSGAKVSNSSFCYSKDYIEIDSTKTKLYLSKPSTHFCFYDEGKNFIEPSWNSNVTEIEIPSNAKYVRFSMPISQCEEYMAMYMNTYGLPYIAPYRNVNERTKLVVENMSNLIAVTYYTYFIEGNCDIIIKSGTYDVATYVGNIVQVYNSYVGMLIGKGNKYYFEPNTKLICNYTGSNENINKDFSVFTSYIGSGDFELINCNIEASRIRYCIHDECGSETTSNSYEHKYINCDLYLDNTNNPYFANYKFALGGGLGNSGIIILDKCIFKSKNVSVDVSYHGNYGTSDISTSGKSEIYVTNCYFEHGMQLALPNPETNKKKIIYTNNSSSNDLKTTGVESYWDIYKWNNEIRVS